ncbi:uncharacterized protein [Palaemon carinicauda]|uniref:uncharacterized protein n=1 Tax=Palaemon carinicauda TaxID=392227 RepID=UPI0035B6A5DC
MYSQEVDLLRNMSLGESYQDVLNLCASWVKHNIKTNVVCPYELALGYPTTAIMDNDDFYEGEFSEPKPSTSRDVSQELLSSPQPSRYVSEDSISPPVPDHIIGINISDIPEYDEKSLISKTQLEGMMKGVTCRKRNCRKSVSVHAERDRWDTTVRVSCDGCHTDISYLPPRRHGRGSECHKLGEANLQEVYHSLTTGIGRAGLNKMGGFFCKPLTAGSYARHSSYLYKEMEKHYSDMQKYTYDYVKKFYIENKLAIPDENGVIDIDVSFDGTWLSRGHKSHVGVGFVIDVFTGKVLDCEILCNYCKICDKGNEEGQEEGNEPNHKCNKNFEGKSGAMEAEEAIRMWKRSLNNGFRYKTFVGDGDSSAYNAVCEMNEGQGPYEGVKVEKEECICHAQKRMGHRLLKMKSEVSEYITTKSGKQMKRSLLSGKNKLTQAIINSIQVYYGMAIRNNINTTVDQMRNAIWAIYYHLTSDDEHPVHQMCPAGPESWCFYNRAVAKNEKIPSHATRKNHLAGIPYELCTHIRSVFNSLADPKLLQRCLHGWTQNPNESLHSRISKEKLRFDLKPDTTFDNASALTYCYTLNP